MEHSKYACKIEKIKSMPWCFVNPGKLLFAALASFALSACSGESWKEEALQLDGSLIVVTRTVDRGGRHEIGQEPPIKAQSLQFKLPKGGDKVEWKTVLSPDIGFADFQPLSVHVAANNAYVVTWPVGCLAYNKWGRPNPPYVVFKSTGSTWQQISMKDLPADIKAPNIIFGSPDTNAKKLGGGTIKLAGVQGVNERLEQPEFKAILREKMQYPAPGCTVRYGNGRGHWLSEDWFTDTKTLKGCQAVCQVKEFMGDTCPCNKLFKE